MCIFTHRFSTEAPPSNAAPPPMKIRSKHIKSPHPEAKQAFIHTLWQAFIHTQGTGMRTLRYSSKRLLRFTDTQGTGMQRFDTQENGSCVCGYSSETPVDVLILKGPACDTSILKQVQISVFKLFALLFSLLFAVFQ